MLQIKLKIYYKNVKKRCKLTLSPRLHLNWLRQFLSKFFIPSPIA